jgi:hypothetical protein
MNINELIDLAQSVETEDPIDWGLLSISEHDTYMMIATSVLEQYQTWKETPARSTESIKRKDI